MKLRTSNTLIVLCFVLVVSTLRVFGLGPLTPFKPSAPTLTLPDYIRNAAIPLPPEDAVVEILGVAGHVGWTGSGVVVGRFGRNYYALTCYHVVDGNDVQLLVANRYSARVLAVAPEYDLALIKFMSFEEFPVVQCSVGEVKDRVMTVGWRRSTQRIHFGNITTIYKNGRIGVSGGVLPGYSGGAIFNCYGHLVGIVSAVEMAHGCLMGCSAVVVSGESIQEFLHENLYTFPYQSRPVCN